MKEENRFPVTEIQGVHAYIDELGAAWLNAEDIARGLGFVDIQEKLSATSGRKSYKVIRWARVNEYLREFGYLKEVGKGDYIPESMVYMLAMKASNEAAKNFQRKIAFEIMPAIRKYGYYALPSQKQKYPILDDTTMNAFSRMVKVFSKYNFLCYELQNIEKELVESRSKWLRLRQERKVLRDKLKECAAEIDSLIQEFFAVLKRY